jgi:hypothetical protein
MFQCFKSIADCLKSVNIKFGYNKDKKFNLSIYYAPEWSDHVVEAVQLVQEIINRDLDLKFDYSLHKDHELQTIMDKDIDEKDDQEIPYLQRLQKWREQSNHKKEEIVLWLSPAIHMPPGRSGISFQDSFCTHHAVGICEWHKSLGWEDSDIGKRMQFEKNTLVIAHEIGHILGLDHQDSGIMANGYYPKRNKIIDGRICAGFNDEDKRFIEKKFDVTIEV